VYHLNGCGRLFLKEKDLKGLHILINTFIIITKLKIYYEIKMLFK